MDMKNNNLITISDHGEISRLGKSLIGSIVKKDLPNPFCYAGGRLQPQDIFVFLAADFTLIHPENSKMLSSVCHVPMPACGMVIGVGSYKNKNTRSIVKVISDLPDGSLPLIHTVFNGHRIQVNRPADGKVAIYIDHQFIELPAEEDCVPLVLCSESGIKYFRSLCLREESAELERLLSGQPFEPFCEEDNLAKNARRAADILEPQWYEILYKAKIDGKGFLKTAGSFWFVHFLGRSDSDPAAAHDGGSWEAYTENQLLEQLKEFTGVYNQMQQLQHAFEVSGGYTFGLWGDDSKISKIRHLLQKASVTNTTILLTGESGSGKTFLAREIHKYSKRKNQMFVHVNCAAIPYHLIESELFGYEDGAFTGAKKGGRAGYFEIADGGTLFLDEITEIPLSLQGKLLEVLQDKTYFRVGGEKKKNANIRLIAATNKNLKLLVQEQKFREDLYYRINVFPIELPPLRERLDSIPMIIRALLPEICTKLDIGQQILSAGALEKIKNYYWPGNIRELENVLEKACILSDGKVILPNDIELEAEDNSENNVSVSLKQQLADFEKGLIENTLKTFHGSKIQTAKYLQIGKTSLFEKIKRYGIEKKESEE